MEIFNIFSREKARMPMVILISCILLAFMQTGSHAHEFRVRGRDDWTVPNDTNKESYDQWARQNRFEVGDSLVFVYNSAEDSVLQVTCQDYRSCNTSEPIHKFQDGFTVFKLPHPGSFYFISGANGHCQKSQKLHVVVMAIRPGPSPAPPAPVVPPPRSSTTGGSAAPPLQYVGFMCGLLVCLCVFIL
eukprot:PITA_06886